MPTGPRTPTSFQVQIPGNAASWPAGTYTVDVDVTSDQVRTTNVLTGPLAPRITSVTKVTSTSSLLMLEVSGLWVRNSSFRDNYDEYMMNVTTEKMSPEDAAWETWTGRQLKDRGFTSVRVTADHDAGIIKPVFSK